MAIIYFTQHNDQFTESMNSYFWNVLLNKYNDLKS